MSTGAIKSVKPGEEGVLWYEIKTAESLDSRKPFLTNLTPTILLTEGSKQADG